MRSLKNLIKQYPKFSYAIIFILVGWLTYSVIHKLFFSMPKKTKAQVVQITQAKVQAMPILLQSPGSIEAIRAVTIPAQVTGILKKIAFQPGQNVTQGQLLFELDPATFQASLQQVQANLKRDQIQLAQNRADEKRYAALVKQEYVTQQQYEQAKTTADAQQSLVLADTAQAKQAEIQLSYAKISSPIAGKTGNLNLKIGDLVVQNSAMITVNPLTPVWVDFTIPQDQLPDVLRYQKQGPLKVKIFAQNSNQLLDTGIVNFIDNMVTSQTGSVLLKAQVPNAALALWPGQLVAVQLILTVEPKAITIPASAIQLDQEGSFVYLVEKNRIQVRRITVARQIDNTAIISQGLKANEKVLITIPPNFSEHEPIVISTTAK